MQIGVCYYPEHWPQERWTNDAAHMRRLGISVVRIGEFAWSRIEDANGQLHLDWLTKAIDTLHEHGLRVVLGTPTATPPRWMLDRYPDMLALDANGRERGFGSRRHYCFSHEGYLNECRRIVTVLAQHYGKHPAIIAWQTDNEYGCHDTSISYSPHALRAFQRWCENHYKTIDVLNDCWGNVFWSMEYDRFDQIGLPTGTVTESNPSHQLAFWRFSSDQIRRFNRAQVEIIREHSPGRDVIHNYMGNFFDFDHHDVSKDLDVASWDNYPLGFLTRDSSDPEEQVRYLRTGHPDSSAFHHDLYRGMCQGRWWVMEQQPGPVNWAPYNPSPLPGMVRLWGWEAFAHGAEVMSYFRWRQAPFAQEQTHTGLLLPNGEEDVAAGEVARLAEELQRLQLPESRPVENEDSRLPSPSDPSRSTLSGEQGSASLPSSEHLQVVADVAIVFDYPGLVMQYVQRSGGQDYDPLRFCQDLYSACRQWGVNVDIVSRHAPLDEYRVILLPHCMQDDPVLARTLLQLKETRSPQIVLFPGTGSRSADYTTPTDLAPGHFQALIELSIVRTETLPGTVSLQATGQAVGQAAGQHHQTCDTALWREHVRSDIEPQMSFEDGWGFLYQRENVHYINAIPCQADLLTFIGQLLRRAGLTCKNLGPNLRISRFGPWCVAVNYGAEPVDLDRQLGEEPGRHFALRPDTRLLVGDRVLDQAEVAVWKQA